MTMMETRVTGVGSIFFKSDDPENSISGTRNTSESIPRLTEPAQLSSGAMPKTPTRKGMTVWSIFPRNTKYFEPSSSPFMINYRVDDLDALLEALKKEGVQIDPHREDYDYGRFAWIMDPDGNRIELWEPPKGKTP